VALAAAYSGVYYECSKAFVKLENMEAISQEEKEKYETIAVALFSKKPPGSQKKATLNCPGKTCDSKISEWYV
jgi:WD repeat-containing protein 35